MPISDEIAAARDEGLTDIETPDLFAAHLGRNYGYFGALDKTLSGFVLLDNTGDDAWLLDLRDTGAVYFQDHEERDFTVRFASLADYVAWKAETAQAREKDEDTDEIDERWQISEAPAATKTPTTPELAKRLQWAVWFCAAATRDLGTDNVNTETKNGIGWFLGQIGPDPRARFMAERAHLAGDPALSCSWLLAAAAFADESLIADVIAAAPKGVELVEHFAQAVRALGPSGTLDVLPVFAMRRARLILECAAMGGFRDKDPASVELAARAIRAAPGDRPLYATRVAAGLVAELGGAEPLMVLAVELAAHPTGGLLHGLLDAVAGIKSPAVDQALQWVSDSAQPLDERSALMARLAPVVRDQRLLRRAAQALLDVDPYHFGALTAAAAAARTLKDADAPALEQRLAAITEIRPLLMPCAKGAPKDGLPAALKAVRALGPDQRILVSKRVLSSPTVFVPTLVNDALAWSLATPYEGRAEDWRRALGVLGYGGAESAIKAMQEQAGAPNAEVQRDLEAVLASPVPMPEDVAPFLQKSAREKIVQGVSQWLLKAPGASSIEGLLQRLATGDPGTKKAIIDSALNPHNEAYVLPKMTDEQALEAARVLVDIRRRGSAPDIHLYNSAGHQLSRFKHPGAEEYLIQELRAEPDKELAANLYSTLINLKSERTLSVLIERLGEERRWFWRMADAVSDCWSSELEEKILSNLRERLAKGYLSGAILIASRYAATLVEHVKKVPPLLRLGELCSTISPESATDRGYLCYVLLEAGRAALLENRTTEARKYIDAAEQLGVEPESDYHRLDRSKPWENPFQTNAELKVLLDDLRSGKLDQARAQLEEKAEKAKKSGKPQLKITDEALASLAGVKVKERIFADNEHGTVWLLAEDDRFVYFDGFEIKPPPFEVSVKPVLSELLADEPEFSERATFWTKTGSHFVDAARFGRRIFLGFGVNNGVWSQLGLSFADEAQATEAIARLRASPKKGYQLAEPWYLARKGGVVRILYIPKPDGSYSSERLWVSATEASEVAAAEALYLRTLKALPGTRAVSVEWLGSRTRDAERTVIAALRHRAEARDRSGPVIGGVNPPAGAIASLNASALDALRVVPQMKALIREAGLDDAVLRYEELPPEPAAVLSKLELVPNVELRAAMESIYRELGGAKLMIGQVQVSLEPLSSLNSLSDPIFRRQDGDGQIEGFGDVSWEYLAKQGVRSIGWAFSACVPGAVARVLPEAEVRLCGAPPPTKVAQLSGEQGKSAATLRVLLEPSRASVVSELTKAGGAKNVEVALYEDTEAAEKAFAELIAKRQAKGWLLA